MLRFILGAVTTITATIYLRRVWAHFLHHLFSRGDQ